MCHILLAGYEDVPLFLTSGSYIERPQMIKIGKHIWYILDNSKLISQVKTVQSTVCPCNRPIYVPFSALNTDLRGYILT
jgi:hypothetical protein